MALAKAASIAAIGRLIGNNEEELREAGADLVIRDLTELGAATRRAFLEA
jgi:phosphoglycolate phosphatase-like HAD superfamily hydrolase